MKICTRNRYATEGHAENAFHAHPGAEAIQYCRQCDAWHITKRSTNLPRGGCTPPRPDWMTAYVEPSPPYRRRGDWYNVGAYAAGDAVEYDGRVWVTVCGWTMDRPGTSDSWREITPCMGEPYCAPELCGPPCHHPDCPDHAPVAA